MSNHLPDKDILRDLERELEVINQKLSKRIITSELERKKKVEEEIEIIKNGLTATEDKKELKENISTLEEENKEMLLKIEELEKENKKLSKCNEEGTTENKELKKKIIALEKKIK